MIFPTGGVFLCGVVAEAPLIPRTTKYTEFSIGSD